MHGNKPIAWPHLGHMDAPFSPVKNRRNQACLDIQTHVVGYPNTRVWKSVNYYLQLAFTFTLSVHEIMFIEQFMNIAEHCG